MLFWDNADLSCQVLCEWLQKIIMATPGEPDTNDLEMQVERNTCFLHTIASYMVKEDRYEQICGCTNICR